MAQAANDLNPDQSVQARFGSELRYWREERRLSQAGLARLIYVSPDLFAKIEKARRWPTARLAELCDRHLDTGGALAKLWPAVQAERQRRRESPIIVDPQLADHWYRMLAVLAATGNAVGGRGLVDVVTQETALIARHRRAAAAPVDERLARVQCRWLEFASWVADNDGQSARAATWLRQAHVLADDVGDHGLAGYIRMRRAQRAVEQGNVVATLALTESAAQRARLPTRTLALCLVRAAQAHALAGNGPSVHKSLADAFRFVDHASDDEPDASLAGHCTPAYVRVHEARCRMLLGEPAAAVDAYRAVLAGWPDGQRLDEGLFRAQFALALDQADLGEEADVEAARALTLGQQTGSRRTLAILASFAHGRSSSRRSAEEPFPAARPHTAGKGAS